MDSLRPCPFCGGEAELVEGEYGMYLTGYAIYCKGTCGAKLGVTGRLCEAYEWTPYFDTEAEAIAAWNSRYHSEYEETVIKAWKEIKDYQERTCHRVDVNGYSFRFECSACGYVAIVHNCETMLDELPRYCPNCGAKVIGGNDA